MTRQEVYRIRAQVRKAEKLIHAARRHGLTAEEIATSPDLILQLEREVCITPGSQTTWTMALEGLQRLGRR